jgi:H+-transporting ATPase
MPRGISNTEARHRLNEFGPNSTPDTKIHPLRLVLSRFVAPVPCLLEAAIAVQLALGEHMEAAIIAILLVFNAALGVLHEGRTARRCQISRLRSAAGLGLPDRGRDIPDV